MNCERCGTTENVSESYDPYAHELFGDEELHWLCDDCFAESAYDV